jgi:hypothetical protein
VSGFGVLFNACLPRCKHLLIEVVSNEKSKSQHTDHHFVRDLLKALSTFADDGFRQNEQTRV